MVPQTDHGTGRVNTFTFIVLAGAETPLYVALLPAGTTHTKGAFVSEKALVNWQTEDLAEDVAQTMADLSVKMADKAEKAKKESGVE